MEMQYAISQPFPASADIGDPDKFERHLLEVTVAVTATGNTAHLGKTVEVGKKTRVHVGAKDVPQQPTGSGDPELEVTAFRDLKETCS